MGLKGIIESTDGLSEDLKNEYVKQSDGNYHLNVDGMALESSFDGLKTSYNNIKNEKKEIEKALKTYKKYGEAEELQNILSEYELLKSNPKLEDVEKLVNEKAEAFRAQTAKAHLEEINELKNTISAQETYHRNSEIKHAALKAINESGAIGTLATPYLASITNVDDEGEVFVVGADGLPLYDKTGTKYISVSEHMQGLRGLEDFKGMFKGTQADGGGSNGNNANAQGKIKISRSSSNFVSLMSKHAKDLADGRAIITD